jgi:O-antigen/teichoic acid export membrane protein
VGETPPGGVETVTESGAEAQAPEAAAPRTDSMRRNTAFAFASSVLSGAFTAVLTIFLVRALGPQDYGVFSLALTIVGLTLLVSNLGIAQATARFIAEARHDRAAVAELLSDAFRLRVAVTTAACVIVFGLAGEIAAAYDTPALDWPVRILVITVFAESLFGFFGQLTEAERRVSLYLRAVGIEATIETFASIGLVLAGFGVTGALAGRGSAYLFAAGYGFVLLARGGYGRPTLLARSAGNVGKIAKYGSALMLVDAAYVLFVSIDVLLIGAILSVTAVGEFAAPGRMIGFLAYSGEAAASGVAPRLTRGREGPDVSALQRALRGLMVFQGIFIAPLLIWAVPLTALVLGDQYTDSADVMRTFAPYAFLLAVSPVLARSVNYLGEARRRVPIAVAALLVNLVFDLIMLPRIGIVAGAYGSDIAYALYVAGHLWVCHRLVGLELGRLAVTLLRVSVAIAAMCGALFAFGTTDVSLLVLVVGGALGAVTYVVALLVTREITVNELRQAGSRLGLTRSAR